MKNKIVVTALCVQLIGCASLKYPNWEYVRIENQVPDKACVYKMQDACSLPTNECMNWHKKRATTFGANTVVITSSENQKAFASSAWTGSVSGGENSSTLAEYYYCNGSKNINPS
jgi:hypothetical protein